MTRKRLKVRNETTIEWDFTHQGVKGRSTTLPVIKESMLRPHLLRASAYSIDGGTRGCIRLYLANPANLGVPPEEIVQWDRQSTVHALIRVTEMLHAERITDHATKLGKSTVSSDMHSQVQVDLPFLLTRDERNFCHAVFKRMLRVLGSLGINREALATGLPQVTQRTDVWDKDNERWEPYGNWFAKRFLEGIEVVIA